MWVYINTNRISNLLNVCCSSGWQRLQSPQGSLVFLTLCFPIMWSQVGSQAQAGKLPGQSVRDRRKKPDMPYEIWGLTRTYVQWVQGCQLDKVVHHYHGDRGKLIWGEEIKTEHMPRVRTQDTRLVIRHHFCAPRNKPLIRGACLQNRCFHR